MLLKENWYLNYSSTLSLVGKSNPTATRYANQFTISPRYESKWLTVFSPISYTQFSGVQWGLGGRLGPVFIGSSGAISHLLDDKTRAFDMYMGVKVPIFFNDMKIKCKECLQDDEEEQEKKRLSGYEGGVN